MAFNITNKGGLNKPDLEALEENYDNAIADAATAAGVLDDAVEADLGGAGRTTETIKDNADNISNNLDCITGLAALYAIRFDGVNAGAATANSTITALRAGVTPAEGDYVVAIVSGQVKADDTNVDIGAFPSIVADDTSDGFVRQLVDDSGTIKIAQGVGSDLSANEYVALVLPAAAVPSAS